MCVYVWERGEGNFLNVLVTNEGVLALTLTYSGL